MKNYKVYCYTGENGKKYVGLTGSTLYERAGKNGSHYTDYNSKFCNAIKKYGFNFFTPEILEDNLTLQEACELERKYIKEYDSVRNGYNTTWGGEGFQKCDYDLVIELWNEGKSIEEIKELTGYGRRGVSAAFKAAGISGIERIKRQAGQYHIKSIYQYDLEGNFIQSYDSTSEAGRAVGTPHTNIIKCLQGARQTAGGFQWREEYEEHIPAYKKNQGFHRALYQYTTDNKLIKEWDSVAEAARQLSHSKEYLATKAKGQSVAYGFRWSYELLNSD